MARKPVATWKGAGRKLWTKANRNTVKKCLENDVPGEIEHVHLLFTRKSSSEMCTTFDGQTFALDIRCGTCRVNLLFSRIDTVVSLDSYLTEKPP